MLEDPISEMINEGARPQLTDPDSGCGRLLIIIGVVVFCGVVSLVVSAAMASTVTGKTVSAAVFWPILSFAALWGIGEWRKQHAKSRPPPIPPRREDSEQ
jgi:hypothetical protein